MPAGKMHADEVETSVALVHRLLAEQFPQWSHLDIWPVFSAGTDNAIYRLGSDMAVRLPRIAAATSQVEKEQHWLPRLAPFLPLDIPLPLAQGRPAEGFPWSWSVYRWLEGENATLDRLSDPDQAAFDLAGFISALQQIDATDGPLAGAHNFGRGQPLVVRDASTRAAIRELEGSIDTAAALAAWEHSLNAPHWTHPPVWLHGDLQSGNLLAVRGRLTGVIDFGGLGVGDPACDLSVAWNLFPGRSRISFREALGVDDATWRRGRGWALSIALIALPYYRVTNPVLAGISQRAIDEVLADYRLGS